MPLDLDRIIELAADDDGDLPPISTAQATAAVRLLATPPATESGRATG